MTDELEKLQRKGTRPTCPHCHATVLPTSGKEDWKDICPDCKATVLSPGQPTTALGEKIADFIRTHDPFGDHFSQNDLLRIEGRLSQETQMREALEKVRPFLQRGQDAEGRLREIVETALYPTVLSTSQPNLMGTTPELQKLYDQFGGEPVAWRWRTLPKFSEDAADQEWELTPTAPNFINPHHHEVQPLYAALAATPAVGGERETDPDELFLDKIRERLPTYVSSHGRILASEALSEIDDEPRGEDRHYYLARWFDAVAAQPASPLRGRDREAMVKKISAAMSDGKDSGGYDTLFDMLAHIALNVIDTASPPEQPAAASASMLADIAQIIDAGWKSGQSVAEVAAEILREFDGPAVTSTDGGMERPSTSAMHDLICAIIEDDAKYDATTNTWDTSKAATAIIAAFDGEPTTLPSTERCPLPNIEQLRAALVLAEDVLSRSPFSTGFWPNDMHPQVGIEQIREAIAALPDGGGSSIAACNMYGEADAEFIVKAVNNHVGLVQALQDVLHWYGGDPSNLSEWSDCMLHARDALSAVTLHEGGGK